MLRSGALFATPFSAHPCRVLAHSVRIFCAFYAFSELSAKCSGCTGLLTEPLGLAWLSTEMLHLLCIYCAFIVHLRTRMQNACRMHVNLHKMALAKLQVHSPDAILPRSSPDHPSPASECHPDRHRGRWLRMHMDALRVHRRECECGRCSLPCSLKCAEGVLNAH